MPKLTDLLAGTLPPRTDGTCPVCEERLATVVVEFRVVAATEVSSHHIETKVCQHCAGDLLDSLSYVIGVRDAKAD